MENVPLVLFLLIVLFELALMFGIYALYLYIKYSYRKHPTKAKQIILKISNVVKTVFYKLD